MRSFLVVLILAPALLAQTKSTNPHPNPHAKLMQQKAGPEDVLIRTDMEFNTATQKSGAQGFLSYFASDATIVPNKPVQGIDVIRPMYTAAFARKGFTLTWHPVKAALFSGGTLGVTMGYFQSESTDGKGAKISNSGVYTTIWKKQKDGSWKVFVDMGIAGQEAPAPAAAH